MEKVRSRFMLEKVNDEEYMRRNRMEKVMNEQLHVGYCGGSCPV